MILGKTVSPSALLVGILSALTLNSASEAATYVVNPSCTSAPPTCFATIGAAVAAAESDFNNQLQYDLEILIYPNLSGSTVIPYTLPSGLDIRVPMKIRGVEGVNRTIIDLQNNKRALALTANQNWPGISYLVEGIQFRNGFANINSVYSGPSGVLGSPFCSIAPLNSVGGAILVDTPESVTIKFNWFFDNVASPYLGTAPIQSAYGGAIGVNHYQDGGSVDIEDNYFQGNKAGIGVPSGGGLGGAIHAFLNSANSVIRIKRNHFFDNFASAEGGAISLGAVDRLRNNCSNSQTYVGFGTAIIESNMIRRNRMDDGATPFNSQGAGISAYWVRNLDIRNNVIVGNEIATPNSGAALSLHQLAGNVANIDHNTIVNNVSVRGLTAVVGAILSARASGGVPLPGGDGPGTINIRNSIIKGLSNGGYLAANLCSGVPCNTITISNSNFDLGAQPSNTINTDLTSISTPEVFAGVATDDFHLKNSSVSKNIGATLLTTAVDLDTNPRVAAFGLDPQAPDAGAYEYYASGTTYLLRSNGEPLRGNQAVWGETIRLRTVASPDAVVAHFADLAPLSPPGGVTIPGGAISGVLFLGAAMIDVGASAVTTGFETGNLGWVTGAYTAPVDLIFQSGVIDLQTSQISLTPTYNKIRMTPQ